MSENAAEKGAQLTHYVHVLASILRKISKD
jgi:hypothetical protein